MYEPEVLMETLTLDEKRSWVESIPPKVFDIDSNTHQVMEVDPEAYTYDGEVIKEVKSCGEAWTCGNICKTG
ncbi:putative DNA-directed RNA polymerase II subunit [Quillaja saponaria]|uniref:DNA-directed RNA polymerase II subunit n=1 Tax=Quillaja saponaria TaxID=32244 RepID=A0AAD7M1S9_QUISA|nr:putative DNA-directed RNA polymerase II subunit [Quillaja saponaria]KAJ7967501.1 putative DNA-directed RNA polymerase II subunit [Quillaja saponaria]